MATKIKKSKSAAKREALQVAESKSKTKTTKPETVVAEITIPMDTVVTKKYITLPTGRKRMVKAGDIVVMRNNSTHTITFTDGVIGVITNKGVAAFDQSKYMSIFTPKCNEEGVPATRIGQYTAEEKAKARYTALI